MLPFKLVLTSALLPVLTLVLVLVFLSFTFVSVVILQLGFSFPSLSVAIGLDSRLALFSSLPVAAKVDHFSVNVTVKVIKGRFKVNSKVKAVNV